MAKASDNRLKCSFCGKSQDQVKKLIAGPGVYICNECVDLCIEILDDESVGRKTGGIEVTSADLGEIRRTTIDAPDEEFLRLAKAVIEPLQDLLKYCRSTGPGAVVEPILRTLLFLKAKQLGKQSSELLPFLAEAKEYYSRRAEDAATAEILEWSLSILSADPEKEAPKNDVLDLIALFIKLGRQREAESLLSTLREPDNIE